MTQTGDEEKRKMAEEVLRRFDFGAKAVNIGGIRLGLVFERGKPPKAEKYGLVLWLLWGLVVRAFGVTDV
ncbi:MAG: hypothetical protein AT713_01510 [Caldivirga sp. JCHS_4]|nr:MAG: hypothetical protein AT713_01510 [Caldivirga sp. JCHS_4]